MSHVTFRMSHITCLMSNAYDDPCDKLNKFCLHVYAQMSLFMGVRSMIFFWPPHPCLWLDQSCAGLPLNHSPYKTHISLDSGLVHSQKTGMINWLVVEESVMIRASKIIVTLLTGRSLKKCTVCLHGILKAKIFSWC